MAGVKFLADLTTSQPIQFQNASGENTGKISMNGDDLIISNAVGDVLFGDTGADVYIGDGVNNVDLLFEQSGAIKADDATSGVTLTLGSSNTILNLYNPTLANGMTLTSTMTIGAGGSIDYTPDTGVLLKFDGQTILERTSSGGALTLGHDDSIIIAAGDTSVGLNANITSTSETVVLGAEQGIRLYSWVDNDTTWSNREQWLFTDKMYFGQAADTNLYRSAANTLKTDDNFEVGGSLTLPGDNKVIFGPNSGWSRSLAIGGNANNSTATRGSIGVTNGNVHIDAATGNFATYLNYYDGTQGVAFGNGNSGAVAWMGPDGDLWKGSSDNSGSKYWHAGNDGSGSGLDADLLDGIDSSKFLRSDVDDTFGDAGKTLTIQGVVRSNNNGNVYGPNFNVSTTNKDTAEYAYRVDRSGTVVGGIKIGGQGVFADGLTVGSAYFTANTISNWNTAYSWGNHASAGYLTTVAWGDVTGTPTTLAGYGITDADNYGSWNLKTGGVQRTTVQSGGTLDIVGGTNVSVSYSAGGVVTIASTDTNTTYSAGSGLTLTGTTFAHADTSSQSSVNNSGRTYIQDITLDTYGHITAITSATETVTNTDTNYYVDGLSFDTATGVLTASVNGATNQTVDLDGRYALSSHTHSATDITTGTLSTARLDTNVARTDNTQTFTGNKLFTGNLTKTNRRVTTGEKYPLGHYTPGETLFEIDPTWSEQELRDYFDNNNVSWDEVANAPGGYAIYINGSVSVGGDYNSGFPYIPIDQDAIYYMECWIKNAGTGQTHYMGSIDYEADFTHPASGGGNPGSYGYWVMSSTNPGSSWQKVSGYITGHHNSNTGAFETDATYWTPQALFNYGAGTGTRACWISGWKVIRVDHVGNRTFQDSVYVKGRLEVHTLDTNTTSATALVMNGNEVEKRTLGSNAFTSTNIPQNVSELTNDAGYITDGNTNWNNSYGFITASSTDTLTNKSGNISQWTNDSGYITSLAGYATESYVTTAVSNLVASAPAALDTLNELAAALGDDANFSTTMSTALGNRLRVDTASQGLTSTQKSNARTNLGLGTAATSATGDFAAASHTHTFNSLTSKTGGTGDYKTTGKFRSTDNIVSGEGSGGVALTINDGYGNANITFNHEDGTPEQNGNAARIEVNTDSSTSATMYFELGSGVTQGVAGNITSAMTLGETYLDLPSQLRHMGDTDTYLKFDTNRIRLISGGTTKFDSNNTYVTTSGYNNSNWDTAYSWGNHASAGYLTTVAFGDITGTPTTLAGYGITDAFDGAYSSLTGKPTLGTLAALSSVNAATITDNSVGSAELNVSGNGSSGQVLTSDGDGTFSWTNKTTNTDTNYYLNGITKSGNTLTFSVSGATNQSYTFGSNAFTSYTDHSTQGYLTTVAFGDITGTPTTLAGYGITDAFDGAYSSLSGAPTNVSSFTNDSGYLTAHPNITAASSSNNSGRTYIQDITLDSNGHVTGIATATETVTNTDTNYYLNGITKSGNTLTFAVSGATNQSYTFGSNAFNSTTIPTNNNQLTNGAGYVTGVAWNEIGGTQSEIQVSGFNNDAGYLTAHPNITAASSVNNSGRTYIQDITVDSNGHVTGITSATETVVNTDTTYSAGAGLDLTGTTFSIEPDLRDGITRIGKDTSNYIAIDADNNNSIDFYISGVWVARMEADGDLHMKGDVVAFSDIFNP